MLFELCVHSGKAGDQEAGHGAGVIQAVDILRLPFCVDDGRAGIRAPMERLVQHHSFRVRSVLILIVSLAPAAEEAPIFA